MEVVAYPELSESFLRAWHEVVKPYFDGSTHKIGGVDVVFPQVTFKSFRERLVPQGVPAIIFAGDRIRNENEYKCNDPDNVRPFAYEVRANVERAVFVACGLSSGNNNAGLPHSFREATRIYDMLKGIVLSQVSRFMERGILIPVLTSVPQEVPDKANCILVGTFTCVIKATYIRNALVDGEYTDNISGGSFDPGFSLGFD